MTMKPIYKIPFVFLIPLVIILYANSSGSPGGKSGSPGDAGATCVQCHSGTANATSGWITSNIPPSGYVPGETYQITATGTHSGVGSFGFELTAENTSGGKVGTFAITDAPRTKLINQGNAVTHTFNGTTVSGNSSSWSANWTAPGTDIGQIRFYAAFNAANGNGNTSGDVIYTSTLFVNAATPAALLSVVPNTAKQGDSQPLTITGQNTSWSGTSPDVRLRNTANASVILTPENLTVTNATTILAVFDFAWDALPGSYDLLVDDLVLASAFTITKVPQILSVVPNEGEQGESLELTIAADDSQWLTDPPAGVQFYTSESLPILLEVASFSVVSNTELSVSLDIPSDQQVGTYILGISDCAPLENAFEVLLFTSLGETKESTVKIYPNPASDRIWIDANGPANIRIFDMKGRLVLEQHSVNSNDPLMLDGFNNGLYIIEILSNGKQTTEKLIVR